MGRSRAQARRHGAAQSLHGADLRADVVLEHEDLLVRGSRGRLGLICCCLGRARGLRNRRWRWDLWLLAGCHAGVVLVTTL